MADQKTSTEVRTIIVPKALEEFFAHRLETRYAERGDVQVIVDRRQTERRAGTGPHPEPDRRVANRRVLAGWWSLPDMPFETY
jgi:hypothetical protein